MTLPQLLTLFEDVKPASGTKKSYRVRCPVHGGSCLYVFDHEDKESLGLYCHAGCTTEDICSSVGLQLSDLFYDLPQKPYSPPHRETKGFKLDPVDLGFAKDLVDNTRIKLTPRERIKAITDLARSGAAKKLFGVLRGGHASSNV